MQRRWYLQRPPFAMSREAPCVSRLAMCFSTSVNGRAKDRGPRSEDAVSSRGAVGDPAAAHPCATLPST